MRGPGNPPLSWGRVGRARKTSSSALIVCAVLLLSACGSPPFLGAAHVPGRPSAPVKVALVDVFGGTSGYQYLGPYLQNSLQVAIDDLNAHGGLLGSPVQLIAADDQYSVATTPTVTRQLLADRAVKVLVGPSFAGLYLGAKPVVEQAQVPNCLTNMAADDIMAAAPYSFRVQEPDRSHVPALLAYLQRSTQQRKIGLITEDDSVGASYDRQLSDQAGKYGLQYIGAVFVTGPGDQRALVQQLLQRGADAVLVSDNPATAARTVQAIAALKAGARLHPVGFSGGGSYALVQQAGDAAAGLVFVATVRAAMSDVPEARWPPAYRTFARTVLSRFGSTPPGEMKGIPAAADCIQLWARAVRAAGTFDGPRVVKAWQRLNVPASQTALGVREQFSASNHDAVPADSLYVYQWVKNGTTWRVHQLAGPA